MSFARMRKFLAGLLLTTFCGLSAQASSIDLLLSADPSTAALGDTIIVDISLNIEEGAEFDSLDLTIVWDSPLIGRDFTFTPNNLVAGAFSLQTPDLSDQRLSGLNIVPPFPPGQDPADPNPPPLEFTFFNTGMSLITQVFLEVTGTIPADGASISATGLASGPSGLGLDLSATTTITSVVPLPAAAWFFGTSLIGLLAVRRRKLHNPATV